MELFVEFVLNIIFIFKIELTDSLLRAKSHIFINCVLCSTYTVLVSKIAEIEHLFIDGTVLLGIQAGLTRTNDYTFNAMLHHISAKVKISFLTFSSIFCYCKVFESLVSTLVVQSFFFFFIDDESNVCNWTVLFSNC